jgi:hypothetical protein
MNPSSSPESGSSEKLKRINPWIGIWLQPRATLLYAWQFLLEEYIHRIYMLLGVAVMLAARLPDWYAVAPHPIGVMVQLLLFGPIGGVVAGYLFAALLRMVGRWMGKVVPSAHAKCMVAWSDLPFMAFWAVFVLSFLLLDRVQGPIYKDQIWLFRDFMGWLPLLIASPFYLWGIVTRLRSIMVLLGLDLGKAILAWLVTTILTYLPASGMLYVYFILYYITSSGATPG